MGEMKQKKQRNEGEAEETPAWLSHGRLEPNRD